MGRAKGSKAICVLLFAFGWFEINGEGLIINEVKRMHVLR